MKKLPFYLLLVLLGMVAGYRGTDSAVAAGKETGSGAAQTAQSVAHAAVQYVSAVGRDANNGLSWSAAKASIQEAIRALPQCTWSGGTWDHCGRIKLGAGIHTVSSPILISSPFVSISGRSPVLTRLSYTGKSGCAIEWTAGKSKNSFPGNPNPDNLRDLTIDGSRAGTETCGLETFDIGSFTARNVAINNFSGTGEVGWWDTNVQAFNERFNVQMRLGNDRTSWKIERRHTTTFPDTTFGYGNFDLWINPATDGTAISCFSDDAGKALVQVSRFHIIINGPGRATAFSLKNNCIWELNSGNIHAEGISTMWKIDHSSAFRSWIGPINWPSGRTTDSVSGEMSTFSTWSYHPGHSPAVFQALCDNVTRSNCVLVGHVSDDSPNLKAKLAIAENSSDTEQPFAIFKGGFYAYISAGTIRLFSGSGSHVFPVPYSTAPVCTAADTTHAAPVKVTANMKRITVTGNGSDVVTWVCTPAAN